MEEERRALGERYFAPEYLTSFSECVDAVFSYADILRAQSNDVLPLFPIALAGGR